MLGQGQNVTYRFSRYRAAPRYRTSGFFYPLLIMKLKDIQNGWMKIPTKWYRETSIKACREHAMLQWLVMNANITESEWNGITIKRGQVVTSLSKLSEGVQQSTQQTRNTLNNIVSNKEVTKIATKTYTIITICNFDDYVGLNFYDNKEENKESTQRATQSGTKNQHREQQQIRDNKDIRLREDNTPLTPQGEGDSLSDFEILDDGYSTTKGRKEKVPRKRKELDTSFVAPEFKSAVNEWLAYKSELGKPYKAQGFKAFYNRLVNLSGGDPGKARKIIEQSMANNWQGVFTLNETKNGESNRTNQIMPLAPEEVSRAIYEGIARARTPQEWEL